MLWIDNQYRLQLKLGPDSKDDAYSLNGSILIEVISENFSS